MPASIAGYKHTAIIIWVHSEHPCVGSMPPSHAMRHVLFCFYKTSYVVPLHAAWRLQSDVVSGWTCCCICRCDPAAARATVAAAFGAFLRGGDLAGLRSQTEVLVAPLVTAFVEQEGSWWFTAGTDDEHGQSAWVRYAQTLTFWGDLFSMACSYSCISISLYGDCDPIAPPVALQAAQAQRKMAA